MKLNNDLISHARIFPTRTVCVYIYISVTYSFILHHAVYMRVTESDSEGDTALE